MAYTYDYDALLDADPTAVSNFKDMSAVRDSSALNNVLTALVEQKGITGADNTAALINAAKASGTTIGAMQNIANLSEEGTAEMRGDVFGGSDANQGMNWLDAIAAGGDAEGVTVTDLYRRGMGRTQAEVEDDSVGLGYWEDRLESGMSIQDIARSFQASEEYGLRQSYSDAFNRDASMDELEYWIEHTGQPDYDHTTHVAVAEGAGGVNTHSAFDATELLQASLAAQKETNIRNMLSEELGIHSTDAQREGSRAFTDAAESEVNMLIDKWRNEGETAVEEYINNQRAMQTAAQAQGDYGQGTELGGTGIHRILRGSEMFDTTDSGQTMAITGRLGLTADDYRPQQNVGPETVHSASRGDPTDTHHGDITTTYSTTTSWDNVWELLKKLPDSTTYRTEITPGNPLDLEQQPLPEVGDTVDGTGTTDTGDGNVITTDTTDVDYQPPLDSDVQDQSGYGATKDEFDDTAAGIDTAARTDNTIQSADYSKTGRSARGVRLKRSKKFKSGEAALGTKQLSRQLQIKSLNI